jgi:hypothetical protein
LTFVVIATLVGWLLFRQAQRRILLHTVRQARTRGSRVPSRATLYLERGPEIHGDEAARDVPAAKENNSIREVPLNLVFVFAVAALAAGCGDTSRATGSPPPPAVEHRKVREVQRQLFSAELELASTTRDPLAAVVHLYRAPRGGWQGQPPADHRPSP